MRIRWSLLIILLLVIITCPIKASATEPIKIFVNGIELHSDVPAQVIDGRTMAPIRFIAEALGAKVDWDGDTNSVIITTKGGAEQVTQEANEQTTEQIEPNQSSAGLSRENPQPAGQPILTPEGLLITVTDFTKGRDVTIDHPAPGYDCVLVEVSITNKNLKGAAAINTYDFSLTGNSGRVFRPSTETIIELRFDHEGAYKHLFGVIDIGETISGYIAFHVPREESNLVLVWDRYIDRFDRFFMVEKSK